MYGGGGMYGNRFGGGMYGMNRMGMNGNPNDPNNPGFMMNSMQYLYSVQEVVMALSEISRTLEINAEGMKHFFESIFRLSKRIVGGTQKFYQFVIEWVFKIYHSIKNYFKSKFSFIHEGNSANGVKIQMTFLQKSMRIVLYIVVFSFFPILYKMLFGSSSTGQFDKHFA